MRIQDQRQASRQQPIDIIAIPHDLSEPNAAAELCVKIFGGDSDCENNGNSNDSDNNVGDDGDSGKGGNGDAKGNNSGGGAQPLTVDSVEEFLKSEADTSKRISILVNNAGVGGKVTSFCKHACTH